MFIPKNNGMNLRNLIYIFHLISPSQRTKTPRSNHRPRRNGTISAKLKLCQSVRTDPSETPRNASPVT